MKTSRVIYPHVKFATSPDSLDRIHDFLAEHSSGVLATTDSKNNPHASVIYYQVDDNFDILFVTKKETKKYENIQHNNNGMLVVYDVYPQTTVQVIGTIEETDDFKSLQKALAFMDNAAEVTSDSGEPPISKLYAGQYTAFRLTPTMLHMALFMRPDPGGYDLFETVQFES